MFHRSEGMGANVHVREEKNPDHQLRSRNVFRCSLGFIPMEVERLIGCEGFTAYQVLTNSECHGTNPGSEGVGAKVHVRERNNSDHQLRSRNPG